MRLLEENEDKYKCDRCGCERFTIIKVSMPYLYYDYIFVCMNCGEEERIESGGHRGI